MNLSKISKAMGALVVLTAVSGTAFAVENAAGVAEYKAKTLASTKEAQAAAAAGNKEGCLTAIKATKQNYKELTGAAASKGMQDAIKDLKVGQEQCEKGDMAGATATLNKVVSDMTPLLQ
jgi:hypothetical protein